MPKSAIEIEQARIASVFRKELSEVGCKTSDDVIAALFKSAPDLLKKSSRTVVRRYKDGPTQKPTIESRACLQAMADLTGVEVSVRLMEEVEHFWKTNVRRSDREHDGHTSSLGRIWFQVVLPQPTRAYPSIDRVTVEEVTQEWISGSVVRVSPPGEKLEWQFSGPRLGDEALFLSFWPANPPHNRRSRGNVALLRSDENRVPSYVGDYTRARDEPGTGSFLRRELSWQLDPPQAAFHHVALLDFDNTLHAGWTVCTWLSFLAAREWPRAASALKTIDQLIANYSAGQLTHDELSDSTAREYARVLRGHSVSSVAEVARSYCRNWKQQLHPFAEPLIGALIERGVAPIIVTGAPFEIVREYSQRLHVSDHISLQLKNTDDVYTDEVELNPGNGNVKAALLKQITEVEGRRLVLAAGDSSSDQAMCDGADNRLLVGDQLKQQAWWPDETVLQINRPDQVPPRTVVEWLEASVERGDFWRSASS